MTELAHFPPAALATSAQLVAHEADTAAVHGLADTTKVITSDNPPPAYTQTDAAASRVHAARTQLADVVATAATNVTPFGYTTAAQADAIRANLNNARADITSTRAVLNQLIDDLQAKGLLQ